MFQYISCYSLSFFKAVPGSTVFAVSIHLMLLFIWKKRAKKHVNLCFNTSHVTLYRILEDYKRILFSVSIHLMLLFIDAGFAEGWNQCMFQYISCYSLSSTFKHNGYEASSFQYISCYSLSKTRLSEEEQAYKFQYISCYSLSLTMGSKTERTGRFNTSHVTLYPNQYLQFSSSNSVSIHLMLLFINRRNL